LFSLLSGRTATEHLHIYSPPRQYQTFAIHPVSTLLALIWVICGPSRPQRGDLHCTDRSECLAWRNTLIFLDSPDDVNLAVSVAARNEASFAAPTTPSLEKRATRQHPWQTVFQITYVYTPMENGNPSSWSPSKMCAASKCCAKRSLK
jgi:hypothetical protein